MKLSMKKEDVVNEILRLIKHRAQDENKRSGNAKTLREELVYARGYRVLADLYEDLSKAEIE